MTNTVVVLNKGPYMVTINGGNTRNKDLAPGEFMEVTMWASSGGELIITEPPGFPKTHEELEALRVTSGQPPTT